MAGFEAALVGLIDLLDLVPGCSELAGLAQQILADLEDSIPEARCSAVVSVELPKRTPHLPDPRDCLELESGLEPDSAEAE